jgi:hypothetical protein
VKLLQNDGIYLVVVKEVFQMFARNAVLLCKSLECRLSWDNNGNRLRLGSVGVNANVKDTVLRTVDRLELPTS